MRSPAERAGRWVWCAVAAALLGGGCGWAGTDADVVAAMASEVPPPSPEERLLAELRRFERERRGSADFAAAPSSDRLLGADPYAIRAVSADRFVGLLRGTGAVVLLDGELRELSRVATMASPSGLAIEGGRAFVVGEGASEIRVLDVGRDRIAARGTIRLPGAHALRDVAAGPDGVLYAVEEEGRLFTLVPNARASGGYDVSVLHAGAGALRVARTASAVVVLCLLAHTVTAYRVDARGVPVGSPAVISNDGPLWSFAATERAGALLIATGGTEDLPLDRTHGSFENIDSFASVYRVAWGSEPQVTRLDEVHLSGMGVVLPKAMDLICHDVGCWLTVTGYGGGAFTRVWMPDRSFGKHLALAYDLPPGTSAFARIGDEGLVIANPLLDAWVLYRSEHLPVAVEHVAGPGDTTRTAASRLGEALIFTTLIAPWNSADGPLSRFTCETCHFEGYVDGRTHATGRGEVRATTKPLLGLFNNRPHFSRALDLDLASVAHNEFRVAGAGSGHDPVFDLKVEDRRWLEGLGVTEEDLTALGMRRAFMTFLMDWSHRPSAIAGGRSAFSDDERRGAALFREHCESCHEARVATDRGGSRVPFEEWEASVFSDAAPIVWGRTSYAKTGVVPYVHDEGARVPSLRRLYKKHPYFTNGAAKSLGEVLARVRLGDDAFWHDGAPEESSGRALADGDRAAIEAFLRLL